MAEIAADTHKTLSGIAVGDADILETAVGLREFGREATGLEGRAYSLVKIAALIALDAPPASYAWQIANALEVSRNTDRGYDLAEIARNGLAPRDDRDGQLVDRTLKPVNSPVVFECNLG